jgi:hypothetical protein
MREYIKKVCSLEVQIEIEPLIRKYSIYYDLMDSFSVNPQDLQTNRNVKPTITFTVNDPTDRLGDKVWFTVTKQGVKISCISGVVQDPYNDGRKESFMTHEDCFEYLDQLPRNWRMFTTEEGR